MAQRTSKSRAAAVRAAREARAQTIAERLERERRIEAALADYFEGASSAEQIRAEACERADAIIAAAERRALECDAQVARAVRELRLLEQTNAEIAELCGISVGTVRALANDREEAPPRDTSGDPHPAEDSKPGLGENVIDELAPSRQANQTTWRRDEEEKQATRFGSLA